MKNVVLSFFAVVIVASFASCSKSNSSAPTTASVMFVDGCAGTINVNVAVNTTKISSGLAFVSSTGYQQVAAGTDSVSFVLTNLGTPLKLASSAFVAGNHYSVFVGGLITGPNYVVTSDDLTSPSTGNAKVRIVNLSTDTVSVTAYVGTTTIASNITTGTYSPFAEVSNGSYAVKAGGTALSTAILSSVQFSAGKIYTLIYTGTQLGTGTSSLTITVIGNN